jgi:hypothetical protein
MFKTVTYNDYGHKKFLKKCEEERKKMAKIRAEEKRLALMDEKKPKEEDNKPTKESTKIENIKAAVKTEEGTVNEDTIIVVTPQITKNESDKTNAVKSKEAVGSIEIEAAKNEADKNNKKTIMTIPVGINNQELTDAFDKSLNY